MESPPEAKKEAAESGGEQERAATARRFRVPRREWPRLAAEHVPADRLEEVWGALTAACPARPRFEGADVFTLVGGLMFLYGLSWGVEKIYDHVGLLAFSVAALAMAVVALLRADGWVGAGHRDGVTVVTGLAAGALAAGGMAGLFESTSLSRMVGHGAWGDAVLGTLIGLGPLLVSVRLLARGLYAPSLALAGLVALLAPAGLWLEALVNPGRHLAWAVVSVVGLVLLRLGHAVDRRTYGDLAAPCYALGLFLLWLYGLVLMPFRGEVAWLAFAGGNLLLMVLAAFLGRGMFLTCGALGVYGWLGHLAWDVFDGAFLFPIALSATGLAIIGSGLLYQRHQEAFLAALRGLVPEALRPEVPADRPAPPEPPEPPPAAAEAEPEPPGPASRLDLCEDEVRQVARDLDLGAEAADGLWAAVEAGNPVRARLTVSHVLYFLGALTVIAAMTFFMGLCWSTLGSGSVLVLALGYGLVFLVAGRALWNRGDDTRIPGGLLVTMAVCMVPLATWALQDVTGFWPTGDPGAYKGLYQYVKAEWLLIEVATMAASLLAVRFVPFPFLVAPMAFAGWYMSMDLAPFVMGTLTWRSRAYVSLAFGLFQIAVSRVVDHRSQEDYAYWGYTFGVIAFWGGLTNCGSGTTYGKLIYAAINLGMMLLGARWGRGVFMVFGFLGFHGWLGWELYRLLKDVPGYPLLVALAGVGVYRFGRWLHRRGGLFPRAA